MSGLNRAAQNFIRAYEEQYSVAQAAAKLACETVERALRDTGAFVHVVSGRAKKPGSLRAKLRKKRYKEPQKRLTDLIGVRVITYYRDAVDPVVARLRREFEINEKESVDKRQDLRLHDFGYSSVHLIARLKEGQVLTSDHAPLRKYWFEIQVRSILEHAWAEIEHEVVYKSGIAYPDVVKRRFASLAGTLELLDRQFLELRAERGQLIDMYCKRYTHKEDDRKGFDVARLLGFLAAYRTEGQGWQSAANEGVPLGAGLEISCLDALKAAGLGTAASLRVLFRSSKFRYAISSFASSEGIAPAQVSELSSNPQ
jgi:ppGpp synthetase/RelA/SpoT-type nucleotidyltranferase